jgi:hypothetical protein
MNNPLLGPAKSPQVSMTRTGADFWQYLRISVRAVVRLQVTLSQMQSRTHETSASIINYAQPSIESANRQDRALDSGRTACSVASISVTQRSR